MQSKHGTLIAPKIHWNFENFNRVKLLYLFCQNRVHKKHVLLPWVYRSYVNNYTPYSPEFLLIIPFSGYFPCGSNSLASVNTSVPMYSVIPVVSSYRLPLWLHEFLSAPLPPLLDNTSILRTGLGWYATQKSPYSINAEKGHSFTSRATTVVIQNCWMLSGLCITFLHERASTGV